MKEMLQLKIGRLTAAWSFIIGTILFLSYQITNRSILLPIGLYYIFFAFIINIIVLLVLIVSVLNDRENWISHLKVIGFLLLNIPVTLFYLFIMNFLNY